MTFRGTLRSASTRKAAIASGGKSAFDLFADELDEDSERAKHHKDDNHPCRGVVIKVKVRVEVWVCSINGAYYTAPYFPMSSGARHFARQIDFVRTVISAVVVSMLRCFALRSKVCKAGGARGGGGG